MLLSHVELSSQSVSILEAEISILPKPETAASVKSALIISNTAGKGKVEMLNETIALVVDWLLARMELFPIVSPLPSCPVEEAPSSK